MLSHNRVTWMTGKMVVNRNKTFRVYPTPEQEELLVSQALAARYLWNLIHDTFTFREKFPPFGYIESEIKIIRKEVDWLGILPAQGANSVYKTYMQAWKNCWDKKLAAEEPTHKTRRNKLAIDVPQARDLNITKINNKYSTVQVPKVGKVKVRLWSETTAPVGEDGQPNRPVKNDLERVTKITGARLVKQSNGWHLTLRCQVEIEVRDKAADSRPAVGADLGIAIPVMLSDGTEIHHAPYMTEVEKTRKLRLEQKTARQERDRKRSNTRKSNRAKRAHEQIAKLTAREARRRKDTLHKRARSLARDYSLVAAEDLKVLNMTSSAKGTVEEPGKNVAQKSGLNKAILNEGWGMFIVLLAYKMVEEGGSLVLVPPHYTSKNCSCCGERGNRDSQAVFLCTNPVCEQYNLEINADLNAALNILIRGLEQSCLDTSWAQTTARQTLAA